MDEAQEQSQDRVPAPTSMFVRNAVGGERSAIEWLVSRFQPLVDSQIRIRLRGHGTPQDYDDIASEVWLVTLSNLGDLRPRANRLAPVLITYLSTTVQNACKNFLRREARERGRGGGTDAGSDDNRLAGRVSQLESRNLGVVSRVVQRDLGSGRLRLLSLDEEAALIDVASELGKQLVDRRVVDAHDQRSAVGPTPLDPFDILRCGCLDADFRHADPGSWSSQRGVPPPSDSQRVRRT